ncbi:MAG: IS4 family transposase [Methylobacter sp.]
MNRSAQPLQHRIKHYATANDAFDFFNQLTSRELLELTESTLPEHRERLFPPPETLSLFLAQALKPDRSCQSMVNDAAVKRLIYGLPKCSTNTGGYCRARQRLPLDMVSTMMRHTGKLITEHAPTAWHWHGRRVRLVDGTTVTLPDTQANQAVYPQQSNQKTGLGFPICRIVGVTCLSSGALLDAAMGSYKGKGSSEQALLRSLLDTFESGDMVLGDAFYGTYFLLSELKSRQVDALFEQQGSRRRTTDFSLGKKLGERDHLITLIKPKVRPAWMTEVQYESAPETLTIRELEIGGRVLITTLTCPNAFAKESLKALYKRRWQVELDIRNIKTTMGMETLSCKTPEMCEKEFWVYLLAYNLIRLMMAQSALLADVLPRSLSFKHTLQLWLGWRKISNQPDDQESVIRLFALVAERSIGKRSGRIEPRAIKRRPKPYPLLTKTRSEAREEVRKYGPPKKLK